MIFDPAPTNTTVIVVEHAEETSRLIQGKLERIGFRTVCTFSGAEALETVKSHRDALLLLDCDLPDMGGVQLVQRMTETGFLVPFVGLTRPGDDQTAVEMMRLGARDCLMKDTASMELLAPVVTRVMEQVVIERRLAETEAKLLESERRLRNVLDNSPSVIYQINLRTRTYDYISPAAKSLYGYAPEELMRLDPDRAGHMVHPDDRENFKEPNTAPGCPYGEKDLVRTVEYRVKHRTRGYRWMSDTRAVVYNDAGEPVAIVGNVTDITERKRAEEEIRAQHEEIQVHSYQLEAANDELRETQQRLLEANERLRAAEERYRTIFENSPVAITAVDADERIISWNRQTEVLTGRNERDLNRQPVSSLYPPEEWERIRAENLRQKGVQHRLETKVVRKNGEIIDVSLALSVLRAPDGSINASIGILEDITERKRIERMKTDFVSLVSHQLKTPVGMVRGYIDNMLAGLTGPLTDRQKEYLEEMGQISAKNYALITDLLNVSRIERGVISVEPGPVDLSEIVELALNEYRPAIEKKGLSLNVELPQSAIMVEADRDKAVQALDNVLDNAMKFTPQGSITVRAWKEGGTGMVSVTDTGIGMSQDMLARLFSKDEVLGGSPTPEGGAGLGMYIAREFMKLQGGSISAASTEGEGSTFVLEIPLAKQNRKGGVP